MKTMSTKFNTAIKVIGGVLCLGLFMFNIASTVTGNSGSLSFTSLKAYADEGDGGDEEETDFAYLALIVNTDEQSQSQIQSGKLCKRTRTCFSYECPGSGSEWCVPVPTQCNEWSSWSCNN